MDSIHLPNAIALPTAFAAPGAPLPPGQVVQALVLELIESGVFRLQLPQAVVDVRADVPLTPGTTITLAVRTGGASARLVIYSDAPPAAGAPTVQGGVPSLAGRRPIGEAVVIARAPLPAQTGAQTRISTEPAVARDAPPISPAQALSRPPQSPLRVATPERAVGEAVRAAASRQNGLAPLFADVEHMVQVANALPAPVRQAANELLALRVPLGAQLTASDVKQAFVRSGVLFEPRLAAANEPAAETAGAAPVAPDRPQPQLGVADDLKAALLVFREVLKVWSASEPAPSRSIAAPLSPEQATTLAKTVAAALAARDPTPSQLPGSTNGPPPPYRDAPLSGQAPAAPSIASDAAAREMADKLIAQTDGALARQTLLQVASLPAQPEMPRTDATRHWTFEIPFGTPQGTSIAQFEVSRDAGAPKSDPQARTWRARFSLDVEPMGPVHALIALAGARASVSLWAERLTTATQLNENTPLLSEALRVAELEPGDIQLRVGAPPATRQAAPGRFMDRAT